MEIGILGAGVAGAAAAIVLAELGHAVKIYERRPQASTLGAGVTLWPNASFVLEQLGLLQELAAVSGRPSAMRRLDCRGEAIAAIDIEALNAHSGFATYSVLRRDLQRILLTRLSELGVAVCYGHTAREVGERGKRPWVVFENDERVESDVLLGADGRVASVARHYVDPTSQAAYRGFVNWVGIARASATLVEDSSAILDYWGSTTRFGIVPITSELVYWAGGRALPIEAARAKSNPHQEVLDVFAAWPEPVQRVLAASAPDSIRKLAIYDLDPILRWHKGHVLLIGDAAHASLPTSGQGACQALEDAWHLGRCLGAHGSDVARAFALFTELRQAKTRNITLAGRQLAQSLFHGSREDDRRRDEAARAADPRRLGAGMASAWNAGLPLGFATEQRH